MDEQEFKQRQAQIKKARQEYRSASAAYRNALTQFKAQLHVGNRPSERHWISLTTAFISRQIAYVRYQLLGGAGELRK
jgi:hypothetical protein